MKKLLQFIVAIAAFSSCSSDDEGATPVSLNLEEAIIGTWEQVEYQETTDGPWLQHNCDDEADLTPGTFTFNIDNTYAYTSTCNPGMLVMDGPYSLEGNVLTLTPSGNPVTLIVEMEGSTTMYMQYFIIVDDETFYYGKNKLIKQ